MSDSSQFDSIRPFYDPEVNTAIRSIMNDPMMHAIMRYAFPEKTTTEWQDMLSKIDSTYAFQSQIVSVILEKILSDSSEGLSNSGFDGLDKKTPYLFISNHRDIILDTSFLNLVLYRKNLVMTASAIGDNLVKNPFLYTLAKINRNFIVKRGLPPRELLKSSELMSEYIHHLLTEAKHSVWIAQREGRTKDGNDATHSGILKMLSMAAGKGNLVSFFKALKIVPISISYEYDPTDSLKIPELLANLNNEKYVKSENEDFNTIMNGLTGQKKHIHIHAGKVLNEELDCLENINNANQQIKILAHIIDRQILGNYKLWASNYIAYDRRFKTNTYANLYTEAEKQAFEDRIKQKTAIYPPQYLEQFLAMYSNPVVNQTIEEVTLL